MTQADLVQIVVIFFLSLISGAVSSIIVRRRLLAKQDNKVSIGVSQSAIKAAQAFQKLAACTVEDYPDKDGDGTPDVFQQRKPLSEMLGFEKPPQDASLLGEVDSPGRRLCIEFDDNVYHVLIELPARPPQKGEYFLNFDGAIVRATINYTSFSAVILKSVPGTNLDDLVDLTK